MDTAILAEAPCSATVGLVRALFLGIPEGGCIELTFSIWGLGLALLLFIGAVTALQWGVKAALRRLRAPRAPGFSAREAANARRAAEQE